MTAALPSTYEGLGVAVNATLTGNNRESCGRPEKHPYQPLAAMEVIEHRTTKFCSSHTKSFVEQMNRMLLDE